MGKIIAAIRSGHAPTLLMAFLHFDISFMIWVMIGALGIFVSKDLHLSVAQKGLAVSVPLLGGAFFRIILGLLVDRFGPKRIGVASLSILLIPLAWGWQGVHSFPALLGVGFLLGIAGASFAVALPLASRAYPAEHQGIAMGIAGAGNSGTMIAVLLAPLLAQSMGWHAVFGLAMFPVVIVLLLFTFLAKEPAGRPAPSANLLGLLKQSDLWWFNFHYSVTFGGFVGLSSFLSIFFNDQYHLPAVTAGGWTALSVFAGSFFRPIGGYLADRVGGAKVRTFLYLGVMILFGSIAFLPPLPLALVLFFCGMALLGMGNGAIFQEIPQRFREEIGMVSGIVGAAGGVGGFFLPTLLGRIKGFSGSYTGGFLFFAAIAFVAFLSLVLRSRSVVEPVLAPSGGAPMEEGGRIRMEVVFGG